MDVFLVGKPIAVGTPNQIWTTIRTNIDDLLQRAPLSLLDAAIHARVPEQGRLAASARNFVASRFDDERAKRWSTALLRRTLEVALQRSLASQRLSSEFGAPRVEADPESGTIFIVLPPNTPDELTQLVRALFSQLAPLGENLLVDLRTVSPEQSQWMSPYSRSEFSWADLMACARGELFGVDAPLLPAPPMLLFDRVSAITKDGGSHGRGYVEATLDVSPDLWVFDCNFLGDPIMPGSLCLDALWQLLGFYLGWVGAKGRNRSLGVGDVRIEGEITPKIKKLTYRLELKRVINRRLVLGIADGVVEADGMRVFAARELRTGLSSEPREKQADIRQPTR